jgi:RNA polymerase sigma factor (sigma-70 family)
VQDVFCTAAYRLSQLREADKLRPWLYAIARNECLRSIRARGRERVFDEVPEVESAEPSLDTMAARNELANLVAEASEGLSDRDREVLELAYRHGLEGSELAEALDVSVNNAKKMAQRLRDTIERALGALLVSRQVRTNPSSCPELSAVLDGWDGQFTVLMRKRIARHIESCTSCDEERRRMVSPVALLGGVPLFIPAPDWVRERTLNTIQLSPAGHAGGGSADPAPAHDVAEAVPSKDAEGGSKVLTRSPALPVTLFVAALVAVIAVTIAWMYQQNARVTPAVATQTPTPSSQAPRVVAPSETPRAVPRSEGPVTQGPVTQGPVTQGPVTQGPVTTTIPTVTSGLPSTPVTTTVPEVPPSPGPGPSSGTSSTPSPPPTAVPTRSPVTPTQPVIVAPPIVSNPPPPPPPPPSSGPKPHPPIISRPPVGTVKAPPPGTGQPPIIY